VSLRLSIDHQLEPELGQAVVFLAMLEKQPVKSLLDEAIRDLLQKRHYAAPNPEALLLMEESLVKNGFLYRKLAE